MNNNNLKNAFPNTPNNFKQRVRTTLNSLPEKEGYIKMESKKYKTVSFKKKLVATVAATFVLGTTAFASGKLFSIVGSSSNIPTYRDMPSIEIINKDFGFTPNMVEKFNNGYEFDNAYTSNNEGYDESGNSLGKSKALRVAYVKGNKEAWLTIENMTLVSIDENSKQVENYKGVDLHYTAYTHKCVPVDYEMTKQDKIDEASGKYVFSVGTKEVETSKNQHIGFELNGLYYSIMVIDSELNKDDLIAMAHEIIDIK